MNETDETFILRDLLAAVCEPEHLCPLCRVSILGQKCMFGKNDFRMKVMRMQSLELRI